MPMTGAIVALLNKKIIWLMEVIDFKTNLNTYTYTALIKETM